MTQTKYHITKDGKVAPCHATTRPCPLGGADVHFESREKAEQSAQQIMEQEHGLLDNNSATRQNFERLSVLLGKRVNNGNLYNVVFDDWEHDVWTRPVSESFIRQFQDYADWDVISHYQNLSNEFLNEFADKVNWADISKNKKLSTDFVDQFQDKVDWQEISKNKSITPEILQRFSDKLNWHHVFLTYSGDENFVRQHIDKMQARDWSNLQIEEFTEGFLREYQDKLDWGRVSLSHGLSESFIEDFADKLNWYHISWSQTLSPDFLKKHEQQLDWSCVYENDYIDEKTRQELPTHFFFAKKIAEYEERLEDQ